MLLLLGLAVVLGCVGGGFALHHGPFEVLWQPSEFVIIGGAAVGAMLIMAPPRVLKEIITGILSAIKGSKLNKEKTLALLVTLYKLTKVAAYQGANGLEPHVENPEQSDIFKANPEILADHHTLEFLCDTIKVIIIGGVPEHQVAELADLSMEVHEKEAHEPVEVLTKVADSLPGLGIVAAVLGIIITMGSIDAGAAAVGHNVAAALVGTFLGVLMSYGIVGPLASHLAFRSQEVHHRMNAVRGCVLSYARGLHPLLCVEFARRSLPSHLRPGFSEVEGACRESGKD